MSKPVGRPWNDSRIPQLAKRYGINVRASRSWNARLTKEFIDQLCRCKDEAARRLLLGCSR
jgi:hypothetical protein